MIHGGWNFIGAAYGLVWVVIGAYAVSLWVRGRALAKRKRDHG